MDYLSHGWTTAVGYVRVDLTSRAMVFHLRRTWLPVWLRLSSYKDKQSVKLFQSYKSWEGEPSSDFKSHNFVATQFVDGTSSVDLFE